MSASAGMTRLRLFVQRGASSLLLPAMAHWWLFLLYLAVLPVAGTIALRNIVLAILVFQSLCFCVVNFQADACRVGAGRVPAWLVLWAVFLVLSPLLAQDRAVAWQELGGQWLTSLMAWFVAFLVVRRVSLGERELLSVGVAAGLYPFVYLALFIWAWVGGFGIPPKIEDMPWPTLRDVLASNIGTLGWPGLSGIPWGFRGFDPIHANLGAAAAQGFVAFVVWGLARWREGRAIKGVWLALFLGCMFLTPVISISRATALCLGFVIILALFVTVAQVLRQRSPGGATPPGRRFASVGLAVVCALCVLGWFAYQSYEKDPRWKTMHQKATIGFWVPDAMDAVCNGISPELESAIRSRLTGLPSDQVDEVVQSMGGEGGRVLVMRAALQLVLDQPLGLDGSRHAYKRLMLARCGKVPAIEFAHPHQGWIDLALALGWIGMFLYMGLFVYMLCAASVHLSSSHWNAYGAGLLLLCSFWFLRGFFDSVYREHYLQMQALLIGFFWSAMLQNRKAGD